MIDLLKLVEQVKDIVKEASKFTRTDSFSITEKEGESWNIVTSADVAVQDFLQQKLQEKQPQSLAVAQRFRHSSQQQQLILRRIRIV